MKQIMLGLFVTLMLLTACQTRPAFTLKGKLTGESDKLLVVGVVGKEGYKVVDTLDVVDGVVNCRLELDEPVLMVIGLEGTRKHKVMFGENVAYTIEGDLNNISEAVVTGGDLFKAYAEIENMEKENQKKAEELNLAFQAAKKADDKAKQEEIYAEYQAGEKSLEEQKLSFVAENPASVVSAYVVYSAFRSKPLDEMKEAVSKLDASLSQCAYLLALNEKIAKLEKVEIGKLAPDFTMNDTEGNPVSLSSFKGTYLLIDFWASWCGPCRRENPNVVKLYAEFKDKGFNILGVSLDNSKDKWLKAIEDDQLTWAHVSDLQGWKNEAAQLYAVSGIPHTVLLDAEGKIIAKNLRGDELRNKLVEVLN